MSNLILFWLKWILTKFFEFVFGRLFCFLCGLFFLFLWTFNIGFHWAWYLQSNQAITLWKMNERLCKFTCLQHIYRYRLCCVRQFAATSDWDSALRASKASALCTSDSIINSLCENKRNIKCLPCLHSLMQTLECKLSPAARVSHKLLSPPKLPRVYIWLCKYGTRFIFLKLNSRVCGVFQLYLLLNKK